MKLKCKQLKALFLYDLSNGFQRNQWKWLFALLLQIYFCILAGDTGILGRLTSVFEGQYELQLSTQWLTFHGFLLFMVNFYPVGELTYNGGQAIIRSDRKEYWLFSKVMWVISTVISYYLLLALVLVIGSVFTGNFLIPSDVMMEIYEIDITGLNITKIVLYWCGMPLLVSITLCITEVILSLFIQPIISFFLMLAYLIVSAYCIHPVFLGNYAMLKRQDFVSGVL